MLKNRNVINLLTSGSLIPGILFADIWFINIKFTDIWIFFSGGASYLYFGETVPPGNVCRLYGSPRHVSEVSKGIYPLRVNQ